MRDTREGVIAASVVTAGDCASRGPRHHHPRAACRRRRAAWPAPPVRTGQGAGRVARHWRLLRRLRSSRWHVRLRSLSRTYRWRRSLVRSTLNRNTNGGCVERMTCSTLTCARAKSAAKCRSQPRCRFAGWLKTMMRAFKAITTSRSEGLRCSRRSRERATHPCAAACRIHSSSAVSGAKCSSCPAASMPFVRSASTNRCPRLRSQK